MTKFVVAAAFSIAIISVNAQAQSRAPAPATSPPPVPVAATPGQTTATFGDWTLRCDRPENAPKICEVAQSIGVQGQPAPVAQFAVGRASRTEPMRITVVLPINVTLTARPRIMRSKEDRSPLEPVWLRCIPAGCIASVQVPDDMLRQFSGQVDSATFIFRDAANREVTLPLSVRGLAQALAAMDKEGL